MNKISNSGNDIALRSESVEIARREEWVNPPAFKHYRTNFFGNKRSLLPEIAALIPEGVNTIFDAFAGTGIVSWALKHRGYRIIANDVMLYPNYRLRAVVGNNRTVLDNKDLKLLTEPNPNRPDYISRYWGESFGESNCLFLETWAANIDKLDDPIKRDIAVFIPITCISKYLKYGHVTFSPFGTFSGDLNLLEVSLNNDICTYTLETFPRFVFNNNCQNECYQMDAIELLPEIKADLAYFDPPYTTTGSYESHYAFYDNMTLALSGSGDKIISPWGGRSRLQPYTYFGTRNSAITGIAKLFERSTHIRHILFSYNTTSGISPAEIETFARNAGRRVTTHYFDRPRPTRAITQTRDTQEVLMLCQ